MESIVNNIYNIVWSPLLIVLLVGAGLYFSIRTRFVQVRRIGLMVRLLFKDQNVDKKDKHSFSSFQAFCVALSGRVGTGNIVGVATAIALGGPGAVFWMWIIAFLGASTAFMESTLAQLYRIPYKNSWRGGPAVYIEKGLGLRWLGAIFSVFAILSYGCLLPPTQSNSISAAFYTTFSVNHIYSGILIAFLLMIIVIGGAKRIAKFASIITPFMAVVYVFMALVIIIANWRSVPEVFGAIISSAFGADSLFGGLVGSAVLMGVKRGLFSNEAGQGGGAIASAGAEVAYPAQQGLVQSFSVYIDTLLVCTATALMILCTGNYNVFGPDGSMIVSNAPELGGNYVAYTCTAIDSTFSGFGSQFVTIALAFFAFTTLMAYYYYGESNVIYIFSNCENSFLKKYSIWIFRLLSVVSIMMGSCIGYGEVWTIGDIGLGLTTWINVIALLILCPKALKALKDFEDRQKSRR